jgi:hypothetical protein
VLRVLTGDGYDAVEQLSVWQLVMTLQHPHLVRMLDCGRADDGSVPLLYAVCEYPDDFLGSVLQERPLSVPETHEVLRSILAALNFVHERGFVHGAIDPSRIMAFGNRIKVPSDSLRRPMSQGAPPANPTFYDAPELEHGTVSPASDMWSLGITLHEMLTQKRPNLDRDDGFRYMAEPFATVLRNCLQPDPQDRWTARDLAEFLYPAPPEPPAPEPQVVEVAAPAVPAPVAAAPVAPSAPSLPPPVRRRDPDAVESARRGFPISWMPVVGIVAALSLSAVLLRKPDGVRTEPVVFAKRTPPETPAPAPAADRAEPPAVTKPSPIPEKSAAPAAVQPGIWRVVAYTYSSRGLAEKKARSLNEKSSGWRAEVFAPRGDRAPYFVALGGRMTLTEAERLQREARQKGMPKDTFVRNFSN